LLAQWREVLLPLRVALGVLEHPLLDVEVTLGVVDLGIVGAVVGVDGVRRVRAGLPGAVGLLVGVPA